MVYKPILQMLKHFSEHSNLHIRYVLFAHFPSAERHVPSITKETLNRAIQSKDKDLQQYITGGTSETDLEKFLERFKMEFGPTYDDIAKQVATKLEANGIPTGEIETLAYPNTIHLIAKLSVQHEEAARKTTKKQFLLQLKNIRTTAISRWTLFLKTRTKLLEARKKQLKTHLDKNSRLRYFLVAPDSIEDYAKEIVLFVNDFLDKYHFKLAHVSTPVLCIRAGRTEVQEIQRRLFAKGIVAEDGYVGGQFQESRFFREPMIHRSPSGKIIREFTLRIVSWHDHGSVLNSKKCDDLFVIGEPTYESLNTEDVNVERLSGATMKEIRYVMGVSDVCE
jgi:hypothetical protein